MGWGSCAAIRCYHGVDGFTRGYKYFYGVWGGGGYMGFYSVINGNDGYKAVYWVKKELDGVSKRFMGVYVVQEDLWGILFFFK